MKEKLINIVAVMGNVFLKRNSVRRFPF